MTNERKFTVINNTEYLEKTRAKGHAGAYFTNPINSKGCSLREQFVRFANEDEGRKKFTPADLLKW